MITWLRKNPTLFLGALASIGLIVNQAVVGSITWTAAGPVVVAIVIRALVSPADYKGFVARNGLVIGLVGSLVVIGGQLADGTVTPILALPLVLGVFAQLAPLPAIDVVSRDVTPAKRRELAGDGSEFDTPGH